MPIRRRGDRWQADLKAPDRRWRVSFATEAEAKIWEADQQARMARGLPVEPPRSSVAHGPSIGLKAACERTFENRWVRTKTEKIRRGQVAQLVAILGDIQVRSFSLHEVDELRRVWNADCNSAGTIRNKLSALRVVLQDCADRGEIDKVPAIELPRYKEKKDRILTLEEEEVGLAACRPWLCNLVMVILDTGARIGEAVALGPDDIIKDGRWLRIWGEKTGSDRAVPLPARAAKILREGPLSPGTSVSNVRNHFINEFRAAINPRDTQITPHTLRHTYASRLVAGGVPLPTVQKYLGHTGIEMTMRYITFAPDTGWDAAMSVLERKSHDEPVAQVVPIGPNSVPRAA